MLTLKQGNLLEASVEALVNTVNEVGVMGKGIALMFRQAYPESAKAYEDACQRRQVRVGRVLLTSSQRLHGPRWIVHFPTKQHWRHPSRIEWVREGLRDLVQQLRHRGIQSIAVPPLGCGNGGLPWEQVQREIALAFAELPEVHVEVFTPWLHSEDAPSCASGEELTPARALIAELVRRYSVLGIQCAMIEVQMLAWFLQRVIQAQKLEDPLRLSFVAHRYGPYADALRPLLLSLDGTFLRCEHRIAKAKSHKPLWFDDAKREQLTAYLHGYASQYVPALERTGALIEGFESPLGMELLATVDWLLSQQGVAPTVPALQEGLRHWPVGDGAAARKERLLHPRMLELALRRLTQEQPIS